MSSLVVFTFPTQGGAQEVLGVVKQLQREQLIDLEDAAVVWREPDGKPKVRQATSRASVESRPPETWSRRSRPAPRRCSCWCAG